MSKKMNIILIVIVFITFVLLSLGRGMLNEYLGMFSNGIKLVLIIASWWISLIPVLLLMKFEKMKFNGLGFTKEKLFLQILFGFISGFFLSMVVIGICRLFGVLDFMMGSGNNSITSFLINIFLYTATIGFVEEVVFRGYIFKKLLDYKTKRTFAILTSSILFGLFHFINLVNSNISITLIQVGMTMLIGLIFCIFREKIKHFNILSLIVLHGVYDAALPFFAAIFRR